MRKEFLGKEIKDNTVDVAIGEKWRIGDDLFVVRKITRKDIIVRPVGKIIKPQKLLPWWKRLFVRSIR